MPNNTAKLTVNPGLGAPAPAPAPERARPLAELTAPGRFVELCGEAQTTAAVSVLAAAQREGETAVWIQLARGDLFPPDLASAGVDVEALIVVHVPERASQGSCSYGGPSGQCRAAELLLRSGGFGLVILDFCRAEPRGSTAWQGRLLGLARQHETRLVVLRERSDQLAASSLGPLTGLRIASTIERCEQADDPPGFVPQTGWFVLRHEVLKNKSGGPVEPASTQLRGPWGFR